MKRLPKVGLELNVSTDSIVEYAYKKGYKIENRPTSVIPDELYEMLLSEFSLNLEIKRISKNLILASRPLHYTTNPIDENIQNSSPPDIDNNVKYKIDIKPELIKEPNFKEETKENTKFDNIDLGILDNNKLIENNPRVFISYSWDNDNHREWVEKFTRSLISNGIVTILDQYELTLGDNLQYFMEKNIPEVDKIIVILTPNYKRKAEGRSGGVGYEYSIISQELFENQNTNKFIPVLRSGEPNESIPIFLKSRLFLDMRNDISIKEGIKQIIFTAYNKRMVEKPSLGKIPDFKNINFEDFDV